MGGEIYSGLAHGFALAVQFNPIVALLGAAVAAGLAGSKHASRERLFYAGSVLVIAWLIGDGLRVMGRVQDHFFEGPIVLRADVSSPVSVGTALAIWAVFSLIIGYVAPAMAGAFTGRRVTFGTGWATAITISVATSIALSAMVEALAG